MGEIVKMNKSTENGESIIDLARGTIPGDMAGGDAIESLVQIAYVVATMSDDDLDLIFDYIDRCRALSDHEVDLIGKLVSAQSGSGQTIEESELPEMYDLFERLFSGYERFSD